MARSSNHRRLARTVVGVFLCVGAALPPAGAWAVDWLGQGTAVLQNLSQPQKPAGNLSVDEMGQGFQEALRIGADNVVARLGKADGFNADPAIRIPLPKQLDSVRSVLGKVGMGQSMDDLELRLNRAAEAAVPRAKELFWQAIKQMTFSDVKAIYSGPTNAATLYFKEKMTPSLKLEMRPLVDSAMAQAGAVQAYETVMGKYRSMPFVPDVKADLTEHVLDRGLAGMFHYIAQEEAAIRTNPARQTTDLLKKVFGGG